MLKKNIVYCVPKQPFLGSYYNGVLSTALTVSKAKAISNKYKVTYLEVPFLSFSPIRKYISKMLPYSLKYSILNKDDYKLTYKDISLINRADLIHFWHPEFAGLFVGKKYIVSCHAIELLPKIINKMGTFFYPTVFENAQYIHVPSYYTKSLLLKSVKTKSPINNKIKVIYPCIDYAKYKESNKKNLAKNKMINIGTLCRLSPEKNLLKIVDSLYFLKNTLGYHFKYFLAGEGIEKSKILDRLSLLGINYEYLGALTERNKISFYKQIDLFVLVTKPSDYSSEGFGRVYIEANAFGVPVIASNDGGTSESVKDGVTGLFVNPTDEVSIASTISKLIETKDEYTFSTKKWAENFDINRNVNVYCRMYHSVLKE